jgi:hypothetical protein
MAALTIRMAEYIRDSPADTTAGAENDPLKPGQYDSKNPAEADPMASACFTLAENTTGRRFRMLRSVLGSQYGQSRLDSLQHYLANDISGFDTLVGSGLTLSVPFLFSSADAVFAAALLARRI